VKVEDVSKCQRALIQINDSLKRMKEVKDDVHDIKHVSSKYIQGNNIGRYLNSPNEYGRTYPAIRNKFAVNK
jgi:hypothetical protein